MKRRKGDPWAPARERALAAGARPLIAPRAAKAPVPAPTTAAPPPTGAVTFFVAGLPRTKGSAKAIPREGQRPLVVNDNAKAKGWAKVVSAAARVAFAGKAPFPRAVMVLTNFYLPRPKKHYRKDGTLRPDAPTFCDVKPDGDKTTRCAWDALKGIAFTDDARIVKWGGAKRYADADGVGVWISVEEVT